MHNCIACRERGSNLVGEQQNGQIPRGDTSHYAIRLFERQIQMVSGMQTGRALGIPARLGKVAEEVSRDEALEELAYGFPTGHGFDLGQRLVSLEEEVCESAKIASSLGGTEISPGWECGLCCCNGIVYIIFTGFVDWGYQTI